MPRVLRAGAEFPPWLDAYTSVACVAGSEAEPAGWSARPDPGDFTVFEAIQEELGQAKRSIPVIVLDHVDEKPLE